MKLQLSLPFPNDQWRYLFLASPHRHLTSRVMEIKEDFYYVYKQKSAIDSRPHITLAFFDASPKMEQQLIEVLQRACSKHQKFATPLNGFDGFEKFDRSTIYIKVQEHERILQLANSLRVINHLLRNNSGSNAYIVNNPHLTVARSLPYYIYIQALEEYRNRSFQDTFIVNNLLLLKKKGEDEKYRRVVTLRLSPTNYSLN